VTYWHFKPDARNMHAKIRIKRDNRLCGSGHVDMVVTLRPSAHGATQKKLIGHANYQPVTSELLAL
jgi:hypothetical protein